MLFTGGKNQFRYQNQVLTVLHVGLETSREFKAQKFLVEKLQEPDMQRRSRDSYISIAYHIKALRSEFKFPSNLILYRNEYENKYRWHNKLLAKKCKIKRICS